MYNISGGWGQCSPIARCCMKNWRRAGVKVALLEGARVNGCPTGGGLGMIALGGK